jgi:hypothetical protein
MSIINPKRELAHTVRRKPDRQKGMPDMPDMPDMPVWQSSHIFETNISNVRFWQTLFSKLMNCFQNSLRKPVSLPTLANTVFKTDELFSKQFAKASQFTDFGKHCS